MGWEIINNRRKNMIYADVQHGKVSDFIITLMTQTKAKKIRAGFINVRVKRELQTQMRIY